MKFTTREINLIWDALYGGRSSLYHGPMDSLAKQQLNEYNNLMRKIEKAYGILDNPGERGAEVAIDFINGVKAKGYGSISTDGKTLFSYNEPIGVSARDNQGKYFWVNIEKYSATTSKHQGYLRRALAAAGFKPMKKFIMFDSSYISSGRAEFEQWG